MSLNPNFDPLADPLLNDSMDPSDPNSIMYDPQYAEKSNPALAAQKEDVVTKNVENKETVEKADINLVNQPNPSTKLRRFGGKGKIRI